MSSALLALSACSVFHPQPDRVRYFTLGEPVGEPSGDSVFKLAPISLPGHLRNRALAIRVGEHEIIYDESVRWTEPLDEMITLALRAQLASRSRTRLNAPPPRPAPRLVGLRIERFELVRESAGERGGRIELTAQWSLDGLPRAAFRSTPREWDGRDVKELVALMSGALEELALSCAAELQGALE
ncbi:hypothetical protein AXK11_06690 [Cephaloticoccus primus]|uniref:ABC-type transport auxiliary lipoprotein component domain-containing protein n=1 Tax=Cephaloticoccus primus TaxID=1548207 RepID=A0A139SLB3_9BACT|nr:ABC-type transport auxiliary lipoprotein family protein [Cephaloticoccus primus]KXU35337.1 hypothetical protein AXK11_06690 [Cephaloticoccus primus]